MGPDQVARRCEIWSTKVHATATETDNTHRATIDVRGAAWIVEGGETGYTRRNNANTSNDNRRNLNPGTNVYAPKTAAGEVNLNAIAISPVN